MRNSFYNLNIGAVFIYSYFNNIYVGIKTHEESYSDIYIIGDKEIGSVELWNHTMNWDDEIFNVHLFNLQNFEFTKEHFLKAQDIFLKEYPEYQF